MNRMTWLREWSFVSLNRSWMEHRRSQSHRPMQPNGWICSKGSLLTRMWEHFSWPISPLLVSTNDRLTKREEGHTSYSWRILLKGLGREKETIDCFRKNSMALSLSSNRDRTLLLSYSRGNRISKRWMDRAQTFHRLERHFLFSCLFTFFFVSTIIGWGLKPSTGSRKHWSCAA